MDCKLPGSSIHGISQARVLKWVAISFFRGFSQTRDPTQVSRIVGRRFTVLATREVRATKVEAIGQKVLEINNAINLITLEFFPIRLFYQLTLYLRM